jgi:hypothetical protein
MSDNPGPARSLYPNNPSALDPPAAAKPEAAISDAARALYGNPPDNRLKDGVSSLGGQAKPSTLLGSASPNQPGSPVRNNGNEPSAQPQAAPFDPAKLQAPEGVTYDTELMGEYSAVVKDLGLDHDGATRLLDLHAKTQKAEAARWEEASAQWASEVQARVPHSQIEAARQLVLDNNLTDPELAKWLGSSPAGNWLPLVRTLANYANALAAARRRY